MSAATMSAAAYVAELRRRRLEWLVGIDQPEDVAGLDRFVRSSEVGSDLPPLALFIRDDDDRAEPFDMAWIRPDGMRTGAQLAAERALLVELLAEHVDRWNAGFAEHQGVTAEMAETLERTDRLDDRIRDLSYGMARVAEIEAAA